jgi:hypothetical protein
MTKDEIIFCINCIKSIYPGIWSDSPEKIKNLIKDVYDEDVDVNEVRRLYNDLISTEDDFELIYKCDVKY